MNLFCLFVILCSAMTHANIIANINSVPMLNDFKFRLWQENLLIFLVVMDLDLMLKVDYPPSLIDESIIYDKKDMERWVKSNYMCIMIIESYFRSI